MLRVVLWLLVWCVSSAEAYELTFCGIYCDDDLEYLPEWVSFHKKQGFEHGYLYNNGVPGNYGALKCFIDEGFLTLIEWNFPSSNVEEWNEIQCRAYMDCIRRVRDKSLWCAFIDTDEFLFSPISFDLRLVLSAYPHASAIGVNWVMYGTSFVQEVPKGQKMTDLLVYRAAMDYRPNLHIKSIVKPKYVSGCISPHFFELRRGNTVNENGVKVKGAFTEQHSVSLFRINHYWLRDEVFFWNCKIPRGVKWGHNAERMVKLNAEQLNQVYDPILSHYN